MIKVEFFHDVICSFCFPMSARMRKIAKKYNNIKIEHKSYALNWSTQDFVTGFGSRKKAKEEILGHWAHANANDDEHRFNIEGIRNADVEFPTSRPGLIASKAAGILGGEEKYWEVFDALQESLFVNSLDIEDENLLVEIVEKVGLDVDKWKELYHDPATEKLVFEDIALAQRYGITSVPSLIIDGKYLLKGAQPLYIIEKALEDIAKTENKSLNVLKDLTVGNEGICEVIDGEMNCE